MTDSIAIRFTAVIGDALLNGTTPSIKFTFLGRETIVNGVKKEDESKDGYTAYAFTFRGILPQYMCENIQAELTVGDAAVSKSIYTVRQYALTMLKKSAAELNIPESKLTAFRKLLVNMLYYGADTQKYLDSAITEEDLAIYGLTEEQVNNFRTTAEPDISERVTELSTPDGGNDDFTWDSATVVLTDRINFRFKLVLPTTNLISVKIYIDGTPVKTMDSFTEIGIAEQYQFDYSEINAAELTKSLKLEICQNGTPYGKTLTYNLNSYIYAGLHELGVTDDSLKSLMKSIYNYGKSAAEYVK